MSSYGPVLAVSLLALALALTALWLVSDMVRRMAVEARALIDASAKALWQQHAATEKTVKASIENQRMMAEEIACLRQQIDERAHRERDLAARISALGGEVDRQMTRVLALITAPSPPQVARPTRPPTQVAPIQSPASPPPDGEGGLARWLGDADDTPAPAQKPEQPGISSAARSV